MILGVAIVIVIVLLLTIRSRNVATAAYYEGYRRAVKDADGIVKSESQKSFDGSPPGNIMEALHRASLLSDVSYKIRELGKQIGRPVG